MADNNINEIDWSDYSLLCSTGDDSYDMFRDHVFILQKIQNFTKGNGVKGVYVDTKKLVQMVLVMRQTFPYLDDGDYTKASPFKKVAYFVALFVEYRPILKPFPRGAVGRLSEIDNHQNTITALAIALNCLFGAKLDADAPCRVLKEQIELSSHSFGDIVDAFSDLKASVHFKLLAVFFEQLAYKANPQCQYDDPVSLWIPDFDGE